MTNCLLKTHHLVIISPCNTKGYPHRGLTIKGWSWGIGIRLIGGRVFSCRCFFVLPCAFCSSPLWRFPYFCGSARSRKGINFLPKRHGPRRQIQLHKSLDWRCDRDGRCSPLPERPPRRPGISTSIPGFNIRTPGNNTSQTFAGAALVLSPSAVTLANGAVTSGAIFSPEMIMKTTATTGPGGVGVDTANVVLNGGFVKRAPPTARRRMAGTGRYIERCRADGLGIGGRLRRDPAINSSISGTGALQIGGGSR